MNSIINCFILVLVLIVCVLFSNAAVVPEGGERVVGGIPAKVGEYKFNVAIHYSNLFLCSGAYLGQNIILTTADCVYPYSTGTGLTKLSVKFGSIKSEQESGVYEYPVNAVTIHPNYQSYEGNRDITLHYYNIAIVALYTNVVVTPNIDKIVMASSPIAQGNKAQLVGWGNRDGLVDDNLYTVELEIANTAGCIIASGGNPTVLPENMICTEAQDPTSGRPEGACTMDHGGPLFTAGSIEELHGLVSWASCEWHTGPALPTIYVNILTHRPWISYVTGIS